MKENKKKTLVLSLFGILSLIVITIGVTYAVFTYTKLGTTDNMVTSGTLKFLYTENTGVKTGIKLTNALPISDTQGKELDGDNNVFDFSIEATNTGTEVIPYEVTLRKKDTSTLNEEYVKVYLTDRTEATEKEELEITKYNKLTQTMIDVGSEIEKTIYSGSVEGNTTNYLKNFRLRMWVSGDANQEDINNKEFTATVNVYSNAKVISEEDKASRSNADIESITIGESVLTKVEEQDYDYIIRILDTISNPNITVVTKNNLSNIEIKKENTTTIIPNGTNINPVIGDNIYNVKVISADRTNTTSVKVLVKYVKTEKISLFNKEYTAYDTTPTLTTSSNNTNDFDGLYKSTATNTGSPTYYFRGAVENNYVKFAGQTWRIVRINEDGTIRIVMQDGINSNAGYKFNTNNNNYTYMYYTNSEVKTTLESWYNTNIGNNSNYSKYIATGNYYCEQAKVKYADSWTSGNATMTVYTSYTPNFKCSTDGNGKGIVNSSIGLLTYDEAVYAGGYFNQTNEKFYLYSNQYFWTMSPVGINSNSLKVNVWCVYPSGDLHGDISYGVRPIRSVVNLKSDTGISGGTGTSTDPFVVE